LTEIKDITEFWRIAKPLLESDPAANTVNLSICGRLLHEKTSGAEPAKIVPRFFVADATSMPVRAVAVASSQGALVLSAKNQTDLAPLVTLFQNETPVRNDIVGSAALVRYLLAQLGAAYRVKVELMLYRLTQSPIIGAAPGTHRLANLDDLTWLTVWMDEFIAEAKVEPFQVPTAQAVSKRILAGEMHILEHDKVPVCMLGHSFLPANSARIGPVYTPVFARGRGYAQKLVALTCLWNQAKEPTVVFLFTDAKNPASNKCYQRVGFEFMGDHLHVSLSKP
jgi:predicted GNAT family acetyltransferase